MQTVIPTLPAARGPCLWDQCCRVFLHQPQRLPKPIHTQQTWWLQQNFIKINLFHVKHLISEEVASPEGKTLPGISQEVPLFTAPYEQSLWASFREAQGSLFAWRNHLFAELSHAFRSRAVASEITQTLFITLDFLEWCINVKVFEEKVILLKSKESLILMAFVQVAFFIHFPILLLLFYRISISIKIFLKDS